MTEQLASRDVSFVKVYSKEESILRRQQQQQQQHDDFIASIPPDTPAVHTSPAFVTNNLDAGAIVITLRLYSIQTRSHWQTDG